MPETQAEMTSELFAEIYEQLRALAGSWWYREPTDHTLSPTAVVHEAYLALRRSAPDPDKGRAYFFASASRAMRRVLVDHARRRGAGKRSGGVRVSVDTLASGEVVYVTLLELEEALGLLAARHERSARVAEMRVYAGMSPGDIGSVLGVSERTVALDWRYARAFLRCRITGLG